MSNKTNKWPNYYLFTNENSEIEFRLNSFNIEESLFKFSLRTYLITHGFRSSKNILWIKKIKDNILKIEKANVIVVDWSEGAKYYLKENFSLIQNIKNSKQYIEASDNSKLLGFRIAEFISSTNINYQNVHCIGHSLGAHG